ncbi:periplasmic heavy metal sensor [Thetidibacter halocola]|uniref:Periplasmic heavy metal sensor n=1 Tax=Thetidibacter halocola TaxID=2827239 RepID=A0A8J8B924_9RHOB|nr:periplasmic heavy metal sensor [Thetidibacter halocola]MBS0125404.1 periplasmic heavy metal sensor [Thetidibacter halocola]
MADTDMAPKGRNWLRVVLFVSLALNLLVLGAIAGRILSDGPHERGRRDGDDPAIPYARAFEPDQRAALRRDLRGAFERHRPAGDILAEYRQALDLLRADPFDPGAFDTLLDRQAVGAEARRRAGQAVLSSQIAAMSPEARRAYAARLEAELDRLAERRARPMPRD